MNKHTPGPWRVVDRGPAQPSSDFTVVLNPNLGRYWICGANGGETIPISCEPHLDCEANARLIATAPEMKNCCEAALAYCLVGEHLDKEILILELKRVLNKINGGKE